MVGASLGPQSIVYRSGIIDNWDRLSCIHYKVRVIEMERLR